MLKMLHESQPSYLLNFSAALDISDGKKEQKQPVYFSDYQSPSVTVTSSVLGL